MKFLMLIGGKTFESTLKNILNRVFSDELAITLTYTGKGQHKNSYIQYQNINRAIICTLLKFYF
jgi:hypothetical protein